MSNYELWCRVSIPNGLFLCISWRDKWGKNRGDGCPANTRGAHMYIYTHWKGKTSRRWQQWGISLPLSLFSARSPLLPLLKHLAFSQAHFCSQSTTDSRERGAWQRRRRRETRLCSDPLFLSSPFLQGPSRGIAEVGLLGGSEGVPDLVLPLHTD